jgi:hypothetical protein
MYHPENFNKIFPIMSDETPSGMEICVLLITGIILTSTGLAILYINYKGNKSNGIKKQQD